MRKTLGFTVGMFLVAGILFLLGCGQGSGGGGSASAALEAGLVPGADVVLRLDFKSARQAPIYITLKDLQNSKTGPNPAAELGDLAKKLEEKLGLKEDDIEHFILSADLDGMKLSLAGPDPNSIKSIQAMMAIQVSKPITTAQLQQTIVDLAVDQGAGLDEIKFTQETIGSTEVIALTPKSASDPHLHLAVHDGKTIYVGLNRLSVSGAIDRAGGKAAALAPAMAGVMDNIGQNSQVKLSFVVPQAIKDTLAGMTQDSGGGPGAMLSGFKDIQSLSLGLNLGEDLALNLTGDLGNPDAANGINGLVSMMKPQFKASLAEKSGKKPEDIPDNALRAVAKENIVNITMLLSKELILALNAK